MTVFSVIATLVFVPVVMSSPAIAAVSSVTYSMSPPSGLKSTDISKTTIGLSWQPVSGATKYRVQYSKSADMSNADYIRFDTTNADVRNLEPDTTYYFKVRVISADGTVSLSDYSPAISEKTIIPLAVGPITNPLKVSSFNLKCANCYDSDATADQLPWAERRDTVVAQIKSEMPDVIGFQEVSQAWLFENGNQINLSQFEDLQQRLIAAGTNYKVTNISRNNCENSASPTNCVWKDQGASQGTKVFYNADTVEMTAQGSERLPYISEADNQRYVAWGTFKQKSSGKSFFFANTHIEPSDHTQEYLDLKIKQTQRIVDLIKEKNTSKLPVVIVGDLNANKYTALANGPYDVLTRAGYIDPLGNDYGSTYPSGKATAETRVNAEYNSFNGFVRKLNKDDNVGANGKHLDYIFTSTMRVAEWEMVLNKDANDNLVGIIPADHNMIVGTLELPAVAAPPTIGPLLNAVDTGGKLWGYSAPGNTSLAGRTLIAAGWNDAKQVLSVDWNSDGKLDLVKRGADGYLTMYAGIGNGSYSSPVTIGFGGWQSYDITATKLRNTDKYPGLVARDSVGGNLYYYPNSTGGELTAPRNEIGTGGWQVMSELNAFDWDKDGNMDIIARNPSGELMLYRTNGSGVVIYDASRYLDYGWNIMDSISAEPNFASPGSVGLVARSNDGRLFYYPIANGKVNAPTMIGNGGWTGYVIAAGTPAL
jgi:endonuclease/exonuclease/phosphatase family metal-dependent hydrolase